MADDYRYKIAKALMGGIPRQSNALLDSWFGRQKDPLPPWMRENTRSPVTGILSRPPERPSDWAVTSGVAESVSPTMGAYGMGNALGEVGGAVKHGDYQNALMSSLPLAAMAAMPGHKGARMSNFDSWSTAKEMMAALENAPLKFNKFGVRVENGRTFAKGDYIPESRVWVDDAPHPTETVGGVSTIGFRDYMPTIEELHDAINTIAKNYNGDHLVLVGGKGGFHGQDRGEVVLTGAESLGSWKR